MEFLQGFPRFMQYLLVASPFIMGAFAITCGILALKHQNPKHRRSLFFLGATSAVQAVIFGLSLWRIIPSFVMTAAVVGFIVAHIWWNKREKRRK